MSGPLYRITTEHLPQESELFPWQARIARQADGVYVYTATGITEEEALRGAAAYIATAEGNTLPGGVYEADAEGNISPLRPSPSWSGGEGA